MNKCHCSKYDFDHSPSEQEEEVLITSLLFNNTYMFYNKKERGTYDICCTYCHRTQTVHYKKLKQLQTAKICPMCGQKIVRSSKIPKLHFKGYYFYNNEGYIVSCNVNWDKVEDKSFIQVLHTTLDDEYVKYVVKNMGGLLFDPRRNCWRKAHTMYKWGYAGIFTTAYERKVGTYKQFLIDYATNTMKVKMKSNQIEIAKNNVLNGLMLQYLYWFDLKSYDEIKKYWEYIRYNNMYYSYRAECTINLDKPLNIYYLGYLNSNNIRFIDYNDYLNDLKILGMPHDKPKNFTEKHHELSRLANDKKADVYNEQIVELSSQLSDLNYSDGNITVNVFESVSDMRRVSTELKNCIRTYVERYATKKTTVLYGTEVVDNKQKTTFAIEVGNDGSIKQLRGYQNRAVSSEVKKAVKKWASIHQFTMSEYM